jgi:hypothetical protein
MSASVIRLFDLDIRDRADPFTIPPPPCPAPPRGRRRPDRGRSDRRLRGAFPGDAVIAAAFAPSPLTPGEPPPGRSTWWFAAAVTFGLAAWAAIVWVVVRVPLAWIVLVAVAAVIGFGIALAAVIVGHRERGP